MSNSRPTFDIAYLSRVIVPRYHEWKQRTPEINVIRSSNNNNNNDNDNNLWWAGARLYNAIYTDTVEQRRDLAINIISSLIGEIENNACSLVNAEIYYWAAYLSEPMSADREKFILNVNAQLKNINANETADLLAIKARALLLSMSGCARIKLENMAALETLISRIPPENYLQDLPIHMDCLRGEHATPDYAKAEKCYKRALAAINEDNILRGNTLKSLALVQYTRGHYTEALKTAQEAINAIEGEINTHCALAKAYTILASILLKIGGHSNDAFDAFEKSYNIRIANFGNDKNNAQVAKATHNMALTMHKYGLYDKALEFYTEAYKIKQQTLGDEHVSTANTLMAIGCLYEDRKQYHEALEHKKRALATFETILGDVHDTTAWAVNEYADVLRALGNYKDAMAYHTRALDIYNQTVGFDHVDVANVYTSIARTLMAENNPEKSDRALHALNISREIQRQAGIKNGDTLGEKISSDTLEAFGEWYRRFGTDTQGQKKAQEYFQQAIYTLQQTEEFEDDHPRIVELRAKLIAN